MPPAIVHEPSMSHEAAIYSTVSQPYSSPFPKHGVAVSQSPKREEILDRKASITARSFVEKMQVQQQAPELNQAASR